MSLMILYNKIALISVYDHLYFIYINNTKNTNINILCTIYTYILIYLY